MDQFDGDECFNDGNGRDDSGGGSGKPARAVLPGTDAAMRQILKNFNAHHSGPWHV
jgi:hypothetical protein